MSNNWQKLFGQFLPEEDAKNLQNFLNDNETMGKLTNFLNDKETIEKLTNFASEIGSKLITCDFLNEIIEKNSKLTDEYMTEQINSFKEIHPNLNKIIEKYLGSYKTDKSIYQIRRFLKSGDCKEALNDPQVKQYLQEIFKSSEFQKQISNKN